MTEQQKADLFTKYLPLAHKLAGQYSRAHGVRIRDLKDEVESSLALTIARWDEDDVHHKFDPMRASAMTWIYRRISWDLLTYCTRKQPKERLFSTLGRREMNQPITMPAPAEGWLERLGRDLGEDARILLTTILSAPADITVDSGIGGVYQDIRTTASGRTEKARRGIVKTRKAVREYLLSAGWDTTRLERAWNEVEVAL